MGISSDGQICYGIAFEEDYQFPWTDDKWDNDFEDWWFTGICGYKPPFEIFNKQGGFLNNTRPAQEIMNEYYAHYRKFKENNPMPVEVVQHCSYDYTMYIVAVPNTYQSASHGEAVKFSTAIIGPELIKPVIDFCEKYCKSKDEYSVFPEMEPTWLLSSMYG